MFVDSACTYLQYVTAARNAMVAKTPKASRGPERYGTRKIKIRCSYKHCKYERDVQNVGQKLSLEVRGLDQTKIRRVRAHTARVKFCCLAHLNMCKNSSSRRPQIRRGSREGLSAAQITHLFKVLLDVKMPWAAALMLLQISGGERASCVCSSRYSWLRGAKIAEQVQPSLRIPQGVNGKTISRSTPLDRNIANLFQRWLTQEPLMGHGGTTWPFPGQPLEESSLLFPGVHREKGGKKVRNWMKPINRRSYLKALVKTAVPALRRELKGAEKSGEVHPFEGFPLDKLGTHSFKKAGVMALKDVCRSTTVIAAMCGTSVPTIQRIYDQPTEVRKRRAATQAFGPIAKIVATYMSGGSRCAPRLETVAAGVENIDKPIDGRNTKRHREDTDDMDDSIPNKQPTKQRGKAPGNFATDAGGTKKGQHDIDVNQTTNPSTTTCRRASCRAKSTSGQEERLEGPSVTFVSESGVARFGRLGRSDQDKKHTREDTDDEDSSEQVGGAHFCCRCGCPRAARMWHFCPTCGTKFDCI